VVTPTFLPTPAERNTGTGLPWLETRIGGRTVSVFHDIPGRWYAIGDDGEVVNGRSFREVREQLVRVAVETGQVRPVVRSP
jgi:hypothetical protein